MARPRRPPPPSPLPHPAAPQRTPGTGWVTSEEQLGVGVQVAAARGLGRAQQPPERGLEGFLQDLRGQSGAAGPGGSCPSPSAHRAPALALGVMGMAVGGGSTGLCFHEAEASGSRSGLPGDRGAGRQPCQEPRSRGNAISAPGHRDFQGSFALKPQEPGRPLIHLSPPLSWACMAFTAHPPGPTQLWARRAAQETLDATLGPRSPLPWRSLHLPCLPGPVCPQYSASARAGAGPAQLVLPLGTHCGGPHLRPPPPGLYRGAGVGALEVIQEHSEHLRHQLPGPWDRCAG